MTDVRALLKAKAKEREQPAQIQHPHAAYNASGQLRCSLCATAIKFNNATAWKTHLDSRGHKVNAEKERQRAAKGKRKAEVEDEMDVDSDSGSKKRKTDSVEPVQHPPPASSNGFPADFFSDPSRIIPVGDDDDDPPPPEAASTAIESEFEAFERAIAAASAAKKSAAPDVFSRATLIAEPELVAVNADGFPPDVVPVAEEEAPVEEEETEAQKVRRKVQDEKEMIMDRIMEEERAQEEADDKVRSLKARLESIKRQRELKKKGAAAAAA